MNINNLPPRWELAHLMSEKVPEDRLRGILTGELALLKREKNIQFGPIATQKIWKIASEDSLLRLRTVKVKELHDRILSNFTDEEVACMLSEVKNMKRNITHSLKWLTVFETHKAAFEKALDDKVDSMTESFISEIKRAAENKELQKDEF